MIYEKVSGYFICNHVRRDWMENVEIAILDTGINDVPHLERNKIVRLELDDNGIARKRRTISDNMNHATICATILSEQVSNITIYDINVLSEGQGGKIEKLLQGLCWCLESNVSVIHLSLGTLLYKDYIYIKKVIEELIQNNKVIIAAYHNETLRAYPAVMSKVIGVQCDKDNKLPDGEIGCNDFEHNSYILNTSKCLDDIGIMVEYANYNSYAVPIMAAYIIKYLQKADRCNTKEVLEYLHHHSIYIV